MRNATSTVDPRDHLAQCIVVEETHAKTCISPGEEIFITEHRRAVNPGAGGGRHEAAAILNDVIWR